MRVFIAGASGVLGRRLIQQLDRARSHLSSDRFAARRRKCVVRAMGGEPRHADLFDADVAGKGRGRLRHHDSRGHGHSHKAQDRFLPIGRMNDRIRRKGTRCLTEATAKIGAKTYLQQSVVWVARPKDESCLSMKILRAVSDPVMQSAIDAEAIAREAGSADGFVAAVLRGGAFLRFRFRAYTDAGRRCAEARHTDHRAVATPSGR